MELSSKQITEWQEAQKKIYSSAHVPHSAVSRNQVKWNPPAIGRYKLNVDASIHDGHSYFKIGMVLRNDKGDFVAGMNKCLQGSVTLLEAEVVGVHEALCWLGEFTMNQVDVESDSLIVVNALQKNNIIYSEVGNVLDSCRNKFVDKQIG